MATITSFLFEYLSQMLDLIIVMLSFCFVCGFRSFHKSSAHTWPDSFILCDWEIECPVARFVSIARPYIPIRSWSEPRPPVSVKPVTNEMGIDVDDELEFEKWEVDEAATPKDFLIGSSLSSSTDTSFHSPFLDSNTFIKSKAISPSLHSMGTQSPSHLKSTSSEWWLSSSSTSKPKTDYQQYTFQKRPLHLPDDKPSSSTRPKSMLDQYLPILPESEPIKSSTSRSLLVDGEDSKKVPSIAGSSASSSFTPYRTQQLQRETCTHEIDTDVTNDIDRTFFWRKSIMAPTKLHVNTDYHLPQENSEEYTYGGYEKVDIGQVYLDRYLVIRKIGWGHFSTVWLCGDKLLKRLVAIKIVKSGKIFSETAQDEISLLRDVSIVGSDNKKFEYFVKIFDQFEFRGDNGKHKAIVFELLGCNLYKLTTLTLGVGVDMKYVKIITKQVLEGLVFLHEECGIIHTDIKPENILIAGSPEFHRKVVLHVAKWLTVDMPWPKQFVSNWNEHREYTLSNRVKNEIKEFLTCIHISRCSCNNDQFNHKEYIKRLNEILNNENTHFTKDYPPEINVFHVPSPLNLRIKIADLGNACYDHTHFCDQIQTCQYRAPETIIGAKYTYSADIWSLACVVFELAAGDYLFDPRPSAKNEYSCDDDHLAHMIELLGPIPEHIWKNGKWSSKFFTNDGKLRRIPELNPWTIAQVLEEKYDFSEQEAVDFAAFLRPMLEYDPRKRISARECLKHPWLVV